MSESSLARAHNDVTRIQLQHTQHFANFLPDRRTGGRALHGVILPVFILLFTLAAMSSTTFASYLWPLPYGNELTSIFGDWRTRHYHVGLDIRTGGGIGLPVVAPADGYVMRLSTSYYGYGKALYFKMNDGNVAVFGHLDHFRREIESYVEEKQITAESYNQNLLPEVGKFTFHRGDTICFSGSTGVGAPHLHFEIRTPDNVPLNPLEFDGLQISDTQTPEFRRLKITGVGNDELAEALGRRLEYTFKKGQGASEYSLNELLPSDVTDYLLAVEVIDRVGVNTWEKPVYSVELRQGDHVLYQMAYDSISFDQTYLIDEERNYQMAMRGATEFHNLASTDQVSRKRTLGNEINIGAPLEIVARDVAGNEAKAIVNFGRQQWSSRPDYRKLDLLLRKYGRSYDDFQAAFIPAGEKLYLLLRQSSTAQGCPAVASAGQTTARSIAFQNLGRGYCLGMVDSIGDKDDLGRGDTLHLSQPTQQKLRQTPLVIDYQQPWLSEERLPGRLKSTDGRFTVTFPPAETALFPIDRNYFFKIASHKSRAVTDYSISPSNLPFAKQLTYSYAFEGKISKGAGLYFVGARDLSFIGADIDNQSNSVTASAYRLGTISMRIDTIPPVIAQVSPPNNAQVSSVRPTIKCKITDNLSGIRDAVEIRIDGKWCIPVYDPESGWLSAKLHFDLAKGKHRVYISITDRVGNERLYQTAFSTVVASKKPRK